MKQTESLDDVAKHGGVWINRNKGCAFLYPDRGNGPYRCGAYEHIHGPGLGQIGEHEFVGYHDEEASK